MSYCQDEWIGEYTYRGILNYRGYWTALAKLASYTFAGANPPLSICFRHPG